MTATTLTQRMRQKIDYAVNWTQINPVLLLGELGFERETRYFKIGDGASTWTALAYAGTGASTTTGLNVEGGWPFSLYTSTTGIDGGIPTDSFTGNSLDGGTP